MKIAKGTIVLVADGSRMLLMRNQGDADRPDLKMVEHRSLENPPDREWASDAPGVVFQSAGKGQSTYGEFRFHQENEDKFAIETARFLNEAAWLSDCKVMVAAPPKFLAVLRRYYDRTVRQHLVAEIAADLTHCTVPDIARRFLEHEPSGRPILTLQR